MSYKVYDYVCSKCGHLEEIFVQSDRTDNQHCSKCMSKTNRLVSAPGMVKGNFYNDKAGIKK